MISDGAAWWISALLLLAMLAGSAYFGYSTVRTLRERTSIPDELAGRLHTYYALGTGWTVLMFCVLIVPTVLVACLLACAWTRWQLPDGAGMRAFGTAPLPYLIGCACSLLIPKGPYGIAVIIALAVPLLLVLTLKWSTTAVAAVLLLLAMPVVWYVNMRMTFWITTTHFVRMAGIDSESVEQWTTPTRRRTRP